MQRWEYKVVSLRDQQYTAALNEFGQEGWELLSVISEPLAPPTPEKSGAFPMPRTLGRIGEAADKLTKLGGAEPTDEPAAAPTSRLLWVFRRPLGDDEAT